MSMSSSVVASLLLLLAVPNACELPLTQPCPEGCACAYARIAWETDCSKRGLVDAPPTGLSRDAYQLDLSENALQSIGPFPEGCRLRRLLVNDNLLVNLGADSFQGLDLLIEVDLSRNRLETIDPQAFSGSNGLLTVQLAENRLRWPSEGSLLASESLKYLDLSRNDLQSPPPGALANCSALARLDLSHNPLGDLPPDALATLSGLEELHVANCGLSAIQPAALAPLAQLKELDVSGNNLGPSMNWAPSLRPLARLDVFVARSSGLEGPLPADTFSGTSALRRVDIASNPKLKGGVWEALNALLDLADLDVSETGIRAPLPAYAMRNMSEMRHLDLSGNALGERLAKGTLAHMPELEELRLERCELKEPPAANVFQAADLSKEDTRPPPLQELSLAGNPLRLSEHTPLLPQPSQSLLRTLDLSSCNLTKLPSSALRGAANLSELVLRDNPKLTEVPESVFAVLPALITLDTRNCSLRTLHAESVALSPRLRTLRLTGNPWRCGCTLRELWAWASQGKGDLGLLEGASDGGLTCLADKKEVPWSVYVKSASAEACGPLVSLLRMSVSEPATAGLVGPAIWLVPAAIVGVVLAVVVAVVARRRLSRRQAADVETHNE